MIDETDRTIDAISENKESNTLDLHIFVDNEELTPVQSVEYVQNKINVCLDFIRSGQQSTITSQVIPVRVIVHYRGRASVRERQVFSQAQHFLSEEQIPLLQTEGEVVTAYRATF